MSLKNLKFLLLVLFCGGAFSGASAQDNVPYGIYYQAVARDNTGKELVNKDIDVRFSIITENPLGTLVYQELHSDVITSKYGVFSLVIGKGTPTAGTYAQFSQIRWSDAPHYLKVEVKFGNDFMDMGTMQFLAVPYALYAQKSLEPGPPGPKGDKGDPASDNQTLSFDGDNLSITNGNTVNLSTLNVPHQLSLIGDTLSILGGNKVGLTNQIQDLQLDINNKLKITKNPSATEIDLTRFLDNTDNQALTYNPVTRILGISGNAGTINLSELKNDADSDPTNELQNLSFVDSTNTLSISNGNSVVLGSLIAFRAKKTTSETESTWMTDYDFISPTEEYDNGAGYNTSTGTFTAPVAGIYTFCVSYNAIGSGDMRVLKLFLNGSLYEVLNSGITNGSSLTRQITMKLSAGDKVKAIINVGTGFETGTGSFSGYKVY